MADVNILHSRCTTLQMFINDINIGGEHRVTASIGAVVGSGVLKRETMFALTDDALYKSKIMGKNCCTTWVLEDNPIDRDTLLIMSSVKHDGVQRLIGEEEKRFHVIYTTNDDEALHQASQYHEQIKIALIELDIEEGIGILAIRYLKQREAFANIPVIVVVNTKKAEAFARELQADEVLDMDLPDKDFHKTISRLTNR